jgi:hypothetical protein
MKKRDVLAALMAGGGISFLSSRLFDQYKNNRLSFSDLPDLAPFNPNGDRDPPEIASMPSVNIDDIPDPNDSGIVVAPENDLQDGFKHTERVLDVEGIDQLEDEESISTWRKFVTSTATFPVMFT